NVPQVEEEHVLQVEFGREAGAPRLLCQPTAFECRRLLGEGTHGWLPIGQPLGPHLIRPERPRRPPPRPAPPVKTAFPRPSLRYPTSSASSPTGGGTDTGASRRWHRAPGCRRARARMRESVRRAAATPPAGRGHVRH